eukprot:g18283.t1
MFPAFDTICDTNFPSHNASIELRCGLVVFPDLLLVSTAVFSCSTGLTLIFCPDEAPLARQLLRTSRDDEATDCRVSISAPMRPDWLPTGFRFAPRLASGVIIGGASAGASATVFCANMRSDR